jgi:transposase
MQFVISLFAQLVSLGRLGVEFSACQLASFLSRSLITSLFLLSAMPHLSTDTKHAILLESTPRSPTHSFAALARRHSIAGGESTVRRWHARWNGTPHSLQAHKSTGRPRLLTPAELSRHVRAPVLAANRAHRAVSYTKLLSEVKRKTRKAISLRTLQRAGKEILRIKNKTTIKRTQDECEFKQTCQVERACLCVELRADSLV